MGCAECPYIKNRIKPIDKTYCPKLGSTIGNFGCCEMEARRMSRDRPYRRDRKLNHYDRDIKYKSRIKLLARNKLHTWYAPAYPVDENGDYHGDVNTATYFKREYRGSRSKYLKRQSNKKLRRYKGEVFMRGGGYRKVFDFWWEMY